MDNQKAELQFVADTSGVDSGFDKVDRGLKNLEQETQRASSALDVFWGSFAGSFASNAAATVLSGVTNAFRELPEIIARGSQIDDIASSFDNLAAKAGASGDALINGFSKALGDTIPKIDLMKQANELLNGGIDPSKFNELAGAARSLAEVTGGSAAEGLDKLSDALLRGRTMGLKAIGVVVDNEAAVKQYAQSLGVTTEALGEEDRIEAIRIATLDALAKKRGELAAVEDDAADKIDQISANIQNQTDQVLRSIATNEDLVRVLDDLAGVVGDIQFGPLIQDLVTITGGVIGFTATVIESAAKLAAYVPIVKQASDALAGLRDVVAKGAFLIKFFNTDGEKNQALVLNQLLKEIGINFKSAGSAAGQFSTGATQAADAQGRINKATEESIKRIKDAQAALDKNKTALDAKKKAEQDAAEAVRKAEAEEKRKNDQLEKSQQALIDLVTESEKYTKILKDLQSGLIDNTTAGARIYALYDQATAATLELASSQEILNGMLKAVSQGLAVSADDLAIWSQKVAQAKATLDDLGKVAGGGSKSKGTGTFLDGIFGDLSAPENGAEIAGQQIGQALINGIQIALSGEKLSKEEIGQQIGSGIGGAIGGYFGGPEGAQLGSILGNAIGGGLAEAFGTRETQGKVRDALDRMFADVLKDNPLQAIIDGQLSTIKDLDFFRGTDAFNTGAFDDALQKLSASAQAAFGGIAEGFSEVFGQGSDLAGQLAAVLADNLGGSLNNLQLLVEASGKSFEDLKKATVEAFLDGKLSALEAQTALNGIAQVAQKGIPDGIGQVSTAFDNLKAAGTKGGRALVDALQDIGFEAKELGQKDLSQVITTLQATGKYSAAEIQQVFDALKASGITSVDQLTKATVDQLLPVLSQLEATKFPFAEQVKDVRAYIDAVDSIPTSKTVELNFKVNYPSEADRQVVQSISRPGGPGGAQL